MLVAIALEAPNRVPIAVRFDAGFRAAVAREAALYRWLAVWSGQAR